jgi:hypothetical protein
VAISSIPQHAVANGSGHTLDRRHQFTTRFKLVVNTLSGSPVGSIAMSVSSLKLEFLK